MKYKNKSSRDLIVPGVGRIPASGTVETEKTIQNPNFEAVKKATAKVDEVKGKTAETKNTK